jgi:hypothetical protein
MPLLGGIPVRYPHVGLMTIHSVTHDLACAGKVGGMDDGLSRAEYPLVGIAPFDSNTCLEVARGI